MDLIQAHQAALWRYLRFLGCDAGQADDIVQDTFLAVWEKPFEDRGFAAARGYLRKAARNKFLMAVRARRARPLFEDLDAADSIWAAHEQRDEGDSYRAALAECLRTLSERARRALDLFYAERTGRAGIANALGMTADGVKTLMRRARATLRTCIRVRVER